ncbi:MAG TPA: hypothetical protein VN681_16200 [Stellaceae bacterium]|nr:hypothetical protein [Stellaceae bacterium]
MSKFAQWEPHYWRRLCIAHGVWLVLIAVLALIARAVGVPTAVIAIIAGLAVATVLLAAVVNYLMDRA